ncbi:trypsin-like peptidase domain-containing protein [Mycobacterium intracellulare]|uniref:Trypsin-like peptidase domain-containing protein n=1 Tax=Mycobacterium intracellulare TaxID=1767 RepID=A0AAE4RDV2_MYCIT|nr:trypsin-like peptidase domain-containing protein [Mycobacterium intracellulare]MCA2320385.1 trypsin-like peptidase domain-containing protein [Mycobacterium intracellulare]MCA2340835.1 trypsin-like peptidase domain-containing protein [Mycobacterium intracellulare]MDV6978998.1 trypsin-like peptidase domain-containing protein [Mycobacterium intracellulare]MDV6984304.1 trypsin-like peptidase domain-containing protein [Mycobacterium intracellulare]MDV7014014.1 trypsin-like peptidase domain-conta
MTNDPRYSPPPQQPGYPPAPNQTASVPSHAGSSGYAQGQQQPYNQQFDWRYRSQPSQTSQFRPPYEPFGNTGPGRIPGTGPMPGMLPGMPTAPEPRKRSRAGLLTAGALAIAVVSAGIGGAAATAIELGDHASGNGAGRVVGAAPSVPAANMPPGSVEQVASKVVPSVVMLETDIGRQSEEGSGIVLSTDGLILTNNHVVAAAAGSPKPPAGLPGAPVPPGPPGGPGGPTPKTTVTFSDGRTAPFTVVGTDPTSDIAVIRVQGMSGLTPISLGSSSDLHVGQPVVAIGSPLGLSGTVTTGIVSALNRPVSTTGESGNQNTVLDAIQTDAAINPGNSGGALVNMSGQLVGVNSAIATLGGESPDAQSGSIGLGFAIPVDQAKRIADELIATGKASHASLGVQVTSDKGTPGAKVVDVVAGGAAAAAGVPKNVVVTKVDDRPINSADALVAAVRSKAPGDKISLTFSDPAGGGSRTLPVTLGKADQ